VCSSDLVSAPALTTSADTNTGIFFPAADTIAFSEGGVEAMRINSSANVGIGTSFPDGILDVSNGGNLVISNKTAAPTNSQSLPGVLDFRGSGWNTSIGSQSITGRIALVGAYDTSPGNVLPSIAFSLQASNSSLTERMRIDSSGNLLVGTTSNTDGARAIFNASSTAGVSAIEAIGGGANESGGQIRLRNSFSGATNPNKYLRVNNGGDFHIINSGYTFIIMSLTDGGNLSIYGATALKASGTTWANPSDIRLKDNVRDYDKGLSELMQVRVREWEYNGKGGTTEGMYGLGVVADEVMQVLPNTVEEYEVKLNSDDEQQTAIKRFDATEITWLLVKSLQEQQQMIETLQAKVAALEAK
jgi:hypothetical protein